LLPLAIIIGLAVGTTILVLLHAGTRSLLIHTWGKVVLLVGIVALPTLLSIGNFSYGVHQSSKTEFCLSCHEMQPYGMSLFVDDRNAVPAVHYQNRLIDRDTTCYSCHKDYALFGDLRAKMNGLRHVWVHYTQPIPEKMALYQPFPNNNCLHCHDDARRFIEAPPHQPIANELLSGKTSCLTCHRSTHDLAAVKAHNFWQAR
jgi:cytochrome c-type protein NapC